MHVPKTKENFKCAPVLLDNWTTNEIQDDTTEKLNCKNKTQGVKLFPSNLVCVKNMTFRKSAGHCAEH